MPKKSLTIDVKSGHEQSGAPNAWSTLENLPIFISNILTPTLDENTEVGKLVSGIPTAFARVDLFKIALDYEAHRAGSDTDSNLMGYYSQLVDEWKGLIACIALDYAYIAVRRIDLEYSDKKPVASTQNVYEPKGAFGNMLLKRRIRWSEQGLENNSEKVPFINIIKYRGEVVGATSPETLLFTSSAYRCEPSPERPWVSSRTGKFTDPLNSSMTAVQVATLHAYISHLLKGLDGTEEYYKNQDISYKSIREILSKWKEQVENHAKVHKFDLSVGSTPPVSAAFGGPFEKLFCHQDILFGCDGIVSDKRNKSIDVEFDPKNLLLDEKAQIAKLDISDEDYSRLPILVLTANTTGYKDKKTYFALPLSALGLNVFGKNLAALVGMAEATAAIQSKLEATYDPAATSNNLVVTLTLITDTGIRRQFKKVYTCRSEIKNKDILIWPNFISPNWDAYYLYNELPHNDTTLPCRAFPFVGEMVEDQFRILVDKESNPVLLFTDGRRTAPEDKVNPELLVISNEKVADNPYKYEIYRSNKPFKGIRLLSPTGNEAGYLIINYSSAQGTKLPHNWMGQGEHTINQTVNLGIDFGSTNTSIAYSSDSTQEKGFKFKNQRVSLFAREWPGKPILPRENQVLFFQGAGPSVESNAVKSVLTLHDPRRLPKTKEGQTVAMRNSQPVIGGFPCFADNLPFINAGTDKITLSYPNSIGEVTQIHNMKWEDNADAKAHKSAFLSTLMLQIYASLFVEGMVPDKLKWSYPSSMSTQLCFQYQQIWDELKLVAPVLVEDINSPGKLKRKPLDISIFQDNQKIGEGIGTGAFANAANPSEPENPFASGFGGGFGDAFGGTFGDTAFGGGFGADFGDTTSEKTKMPQPDAITASADAFMPDDTDKSISYKPEPFYSNHRKNRSLSEAEAVANFIASSGDLRDCLYLCFDIGGSTTDISALFKLWSDDDPDGHITMIKQNSIRFAAQRVSDSVSHFPEFQKVLSHICSRHNIKMVGLNLGQTTYNSATAPYFFNQIVNRLNDDQLRDFYASIVSDCPRLMCVNLYVTGLLMYYAGQIARKLVDDLNHTVDSEWPARRKPAVQVSFAGKGSRLFQWLDALNPDGAYQYYGQMFVLGYGKEHLMSTLAGWQNIKLPKLHDPNIKFEVSKGLAKGDTILYRPSLEQPSEIIGEDGFEVTGNDNVSRPLDFTNSITPTMLRSIGSRFFPDTSKPQASKFTEFCGFFYNAASKMFNMQIDPRAMAEACRTLNIVSYIQNMPEFRAAVTQARAQNGNEFDFVAPIIILEGMKFYDDTFMKLLAR